MRFRPPLLIGKYSLILALLMGLFAGCSSSGDISTSGQSITWDSVTMTIDKRFLSTDITSLINPTLRQSIIQAYSIPSPSSEFFEKNIIISRESSVTMDLTSYASNIANSIQQTRGGYNRSYLSDDSFSCREKEVKSFVHNFSLARGGIADTGSQVLFFLQYIFGLDNNFYIVSASTDDENDIDVFQGYMDTLTCADTIFLTGVES